MGQTSIWQKLKNGDYPIITLERRRARFRRDGRGYLWLPAVAALLVVPVFLLAVLCWFIDPAGAVLRCGTMPLAEGFATLLLLIQSAVLFLAVPICSAQAICAERESGTFAVLALTPMSSSSIIGQKLAIPLGIVLLPAVVSLLALIPGVARVPALRVFPVYVGGLAYPIYALLFAATGVLSSCYFQSSRTAVPYTYVAVLCSALLPQGLRAFIQLLALERAAWPLYTLFMAVLPLGLAAGFIWQSIRRLDWLRTHAGGTA